MKKHLAILSVLVVVVGLLSSCSSSEDCECTAVDKIISGTVTNTNEKGEEYAENIYSDGENRSFLFSDWGKDCSEITLEDVPEKWQGIFTENCVITCSEK
ncbi:MAG: hypothetical protein Q4Q06_01080 [Bacteroidota bacterium]|nr:hypothetical protein [Bacteroidota bacterium]